MKSPYNMGLIFVLFVLSVCSNLFSIEVLEEIPQNNTIGNSINSQVMFKIISNEITQGVDLGSIDVNINDEHYSYGTNGFSSIYLGQQYEGDSYRIIISPELPFSYGELVSVEVNAEDYTGSAMLPFLWSFTVLDDTAPPVVWNQVPSPEESGVDIDSSISFNLTDGVSGVDIETVQVNLHTSHSGMNSVYYTSDELEYDSINNGYSFLLDITESFTLGDTVDITISAGDNAGNITVEDYRYYIETGQDHTYTTNYDPQPGDDDVVVDSAVSFDIFNMVEGVFVDTTMLSVIIQGEQYSYLNAENMELIAINNTSGINIGYHVVVFPYNEFDYGELISVQINAIATDGIYMETFNYSFSTIYDNIAPYIGSRDPANNETGVAIDSEVSFQIVDALSGIDLAGIDVWINGTYYNHLDNGFSSQQIENGYQVNIIPDFLPPDSNIAVEIQAEDLCGNQVTDNYSFSTEILSNDTEPPFILEMYPENGALNLPLDALIEVTCFDADPGIDPAGIFMQINGESVVPVVEPDLSFGTTEQGYYAAYNVSYQISETEAGDISWGISTSDMLGNVYNEMLAEEFTFSCIESIPPVINLPEEFSFLEDSTLEIDFADYAYDPDGDFEIEYSGNSNIIIEIDDYLVSFSASDNWFGLENIEFTVTDGFGIDSDFVMINVISVNDAPVLEIPVDNYTIYEDSTLTIDFTSFIEDVDGDDVILTATGQENVNIVIEEFQVTISAEENWFGSEDIIFTVYDNGSRLSDSETIEVVFEAVNDIPVMELPEEILLVEDTPELIDFNPYIYDVEGDALELEFTGNNQIEIELDQLLVLFDPAEDWFGTEEVTFQVRDSESVWVEMQVSVQVAAVNDVPVLNLPELIEFNEDEEYILDVSEYASDDDGDVLLTFCNNSTHINVSINSLVITLTPFENWFGDDLISIYIDDHNGGIADGTLNISVLPVNDSPVLDLPEDVTINGDSTLVLDFSNYLSDIDSDLEEISLDFSGNENISVEVFDLLVSFYVIGSWQGQEEILFFASDGENVSAQESLVVIAEQENINHAPEIDLPPSFAFNEDEETVIDFSEYVFDEDEDPLQITFSGNEFIEVSVNGYNVIFRAEQNWYGSEVISFTVSDSRNRESVSEEVLINVEPVNDAPVFEPVFDIIIDKDQTINVDLGVYVSDLEGDLFTLSLSEGQGIEVEQSGTIFTIIPQADCPNIQSLTLTADETTSGLISSTMFGLFVFQPVVDISALEDAEKAGEFTFEEGSGINEIDFTQFFNEDYENLILTSPLDNVASDSLEISITDLIVSFEPQQNWIGALQIPFTVSYLQSRARRDFEVRVRVTAHKAGEYVEPIPHLVSWEWEHCDIFITTEESMAEVSCKILDKRGRKIKELAIDDDIGSDMRYKARWDKTDEDDHAVSGGLYIYRVDINDRIYQGTIIIAR